MIISKAKGPAEAATSPSHGSTNPQKDKVMNRSEDTTAAPKIARDFPIPYPGTAPNDDLYSARLLLDIIFDALLRAASKPRGMNRDEALQSTHVAGLIVEHLATLQRLLDDDAAQSLTKEYQRVRRQEIVERWGALS